jgi:coenzyme Q-binding protein COQ10
MPSHSETRVLPYTPEQLFDLVMDIEAYPRFLPWCTAARIHTRAKNALEADVVIGYGPLSERFSSRVHYTRPKEIEVEYMKGPMRNLHNKWRFKKAKGGCEVDFEVEFTMKSRLFGVLVDQFFHRVLARMIDAFEKRAEALYGK